MNTAGAVEGGKNETYIIDTQAPLLTLSTLADGALTNNDTLNVAGTITDTNGVAGVTINGAAMPVNEDGTFSHALHLLSGPNTITTVATDLAGNASTDERTIILDQSAPVITISYPSDNSATNEVTTTVTGTVDKTATVSITFNNTSSVPAIITDSTFSFPIAYEYGQNTIEITAIDLAGNIGTVKRTVTFDNISPAMAITTPAQDITTNQAGILLKGTVADLTITEVTITCDGITSTPTVSARMFEQQLTFVDEKTYAVIVTATDAAGNTSSVQRNIIYDRTPPALTIDPVQTPTNTSQQVVTGTMELHSTVTITCLTATVGEVSYPTDTTWSVIIAVLTEGTNLIMVSATDRIGNIANPASATIMLDTQAPDSLITIGPAALTNQNTASFSFISTNDGLAFECKLDSGTYSVCVSPVSYIGLIDGTHTFMVRATDPAGNTDQTPAVYIWTVDTFPPIAVIIGAPPSPTNARSASLTVTGDDVIAYRYNLDFGVFYAETSTSTPILLSGLLDGTHKVFLKGRDSAGNWQRDENATLVSWVVDITPPGLILSTLGDGSYTNNPIVNIAGTASDANGIQSVVVSGQTVTPSTSDNVNYTFSQAVSLATGSNTITAFATDLAGNNTTDTRTIVLDQTAPQITITIPADNSVVNNPSITLSGAIDKTATILFSLNSGPTVTAATNATTFSLPVTLATNTNNTIFVYATDLAGNPVVFRINPA